MTQRVAMTAAGTVVARGLMVGLLAGAALGGLVGTVEWPVVATFFGAVLGGLVGLVTGLAAGLVLAAMSRRNARQRRLRAACGAVFLAGTLTAVLLASADRTALDVAGDAVIAVAALAAGAWAGPRIARGFPAVGVPWRESPVPAGRLYGRAIALGAGVGAGVGGVTGLVIGWIAYPPTAGFAMIEVAILGSVSGVVLATLLVGLLALADVWRRT